MKKITKIYIPIILITIFTVGNILVNKIKAEATVESTEVTIRINENNEASVNLIYRISNTDNSMLVSGKEITLPFTNVTNVSAALDGSAVDTSLVGFTSDSTVIAVHFDTLAIHPARSASLSLDFTATNVSEVNHNIRELVLTDNYSKDSTTTLNFYFPRSWGKPTLVTSSAVQRPSDIENFEKYILSGSQRYLMLWGETYSLDLKATYEVLRSENGRDFFLLNLIDQKPGFNVSYSKIEGALHGVYDLNENSFALVRLDEDKEIGFELKIERTNLDNTKIIEDGDSKEFKSIQIDFDKGSSIGKEIWDKVKDSQDPRSSLRVANDILASKTTGDLSTKTTVSNIFDKTDGFTSFESCYILSSLADSIGVEAQINYGYVIFPYITKLTPHIWCKFKINDEIFIADPSLQGINGFIYFGVTTDFDRITVGTWNPNNEGDIALGQLSNDSFIEEIVILQQPLTIESENSAELDVEFPFSINAGTHYKGNVSIENKSARILKLKDLKLAGDSAIGSAIINGELYPAALPNITNEFEVVGKVTNFFKHGADELEVEVYFDDEYIQLEKDSVFVTYSINTTLVWLGVGMGILTGLTLLFILFHARRVKIKVQKNRYY